MLDTNGNVFGTTSDGGGMTGGGSVFEIVKNSNVVTNLASFTAFVAPGSPNSGVTVISAATCLEPPSFS